MVAPKPFHIYPGAVIRVDADELEIVASIGDVINTAKPLPPEPWFSLDEDIFDKLLQNMLLWKEFDQKYSTTATAHARQEIMDKLSTNTELAYMETIWRLIKKKGK